MTEVEMFEKIKPLAKYNENWVKTWQVGTIVGLSIVQIGIKIKQGPLKEAEPNIFIKQTVQTEIWLSSYFQLKKKIKTAVSSVVST